MISRQGNVLTRAVRVSGAQADSAPTIAKRRVLRVERHPRRPSLDLVSIVGISPFAGLDRVDRIVRETVELL
jgi:hypothetical protein